MAWLVDFSLSKPPEPAGRPAANHGREPSHSTYPVLACETILITMFFALTRTILARDTRARASLPPPPLGILA